MAWKIVKDKVDEGAWGDVDKGAIGRALAEAFAAGEVTRAQIKEVYAFVPADAFGKDADGKPTFASSKGWGPHHVVDGTSITVNRGGVIGGAQALAGARSKPSLAGADLASAKAHIRKHYKSLKLEVPDSLKEALAVRRVGQGQPLVELVKGSLEYTRQSIADAFRRAFEQPDYRYDYNGDSKWCPFYIVDTFADCVIVTVVSMEDAELAPDEYFRVAYTVEADAGLPGRIVFAQRDAWEVVELAYKAQEAGGKGQDAGSKRQEAGGKTQEARGVGKTQEEAAEGVEPPALLENEPEILRQMNLPQNDSGAGGPQNDSRAGGPQNDSPADRAADRPADRAGNGRRGARLLEEQAGAVGVELLEASADGKTRGIRIAGLMTAGVVNGNGRRYPQSVIEAAVAVWAKHLHESAGQGRLKILTGEADHPGDKGKKRPQFLETVVKWTDLRMDGARLDVTGELILTSKGKDVEALMEAGVKPGGSVRGYYESHTVKQDTPGTAWKSVEEVDWCEFTGADLVGDPSFENVADLLESKRLQQRIGETGQRAPGAPLQGARKMDPEEIRKFIAEHPEMFEGMIKGKVDEAVRAMGADQLKSLEEAVKKAQGDADKAAAELEGRRRAEAVEKAISEAVKDLPYGGEMNTVFVEAVRAEADRFAQSDKPAEAVKAFVESKRREYDRLASKARLAAMGKPGGLQVIGPVIEAETGMPEFARASLEFYESLVEAGHVQRRNLAKPATLNEIAAAKVLKRFDALYMRQLMRESQQLREAETATDLNVPYAVSRAILQAVWPQLISTSIFDFNTVDLPLTYVYYEAYAGESGVTAAVTGDTTTMTALGTWYDLDHKMIQPGTVVAVNASNGNAALTEGTDYLIDYMYGKIFAISGGGVSAGNSISANYTYDVVREGESQAIQRGELQLSRATLTCAANRLAQEITSEAVVFSRAQLGWDATTRTLAALVSQLRRKVDKVLMYNGLSMALSVASNSGGTWTAATDPLINLVSYVGVAKVKVQARFYEPTFLLLSATNSDRLGNWDGFTAAGKRPDVDLNANGYVGRLKGLPVFESTEFSDSYALTGNRELVMYRVFQPMALKGPYPSYSSNNLVASEQWYAEQYDGAVSPVAGKGATVKIV